MTLSFLFQKGSLWRMPYISQKCHGHRHLLDEITRMEILEYVEAEDDIMDYSGSKGEQSMDDGDEQSMDDDEQSMDDDDVDQQ
jgi:hypothetical protein